MRRTKKNLADLVSDLIAWGEAADRMARRTDREAIMRDEQAELALSRAVEIVGEVSGRLLSFFPDQWNEDEKRELKGAYRTRNRLAHGYDEVSPRILLDIATNDIWRLTNMARTWRIELGERP